jgi:hypothetical protein
VLFLWLKCWSVAKWMNICLFLSLFIDTYLHRLWDDNYCWWIGKDVEGSHYGLLKCHPSICLEGLGKTSKTINKIAGIWASNSTWELSNVKQECKPRSPNHQ